MDLFKRTMTAKKTDKVVKKINAPTLSKYFNAEYVVYMVFHNGGIAPGGSGNVMFPEFFGCGVS
ncbi:MAG: hypothetical protein Q7K40_03710, partial [bacterium]|nr:hypothetical protein [bacterium]